MNTNPPMPVRTTITEWIEFARNGPSHEPLVVTEDEWKIVCDLLNGGVDSRWRPCLCGRPVTIVVGEPAWFITNT